MRLPTISTFLKPLRGMSAPYRSTETVLLLVAEGAATLRVGDDAWLLSQHDLAFIPPWTCYAL